MNKYIIKKYGVDFIFVYNTQTNTKGSRSKKVALDLKEKTKAYFKYEKYNCSESCSEKMSYEIAKVLGYDCARIELAVDHNNVVGILNYLFIDRSEKVHYDAKDFLNSNGRNMKEYHTIDNIKGFLDKLNPKLFADFLKIMVFDALIGETDRHSENWGITIDSKGYRISCLYDNGCNLLREFKDLQLANQYYDGLKEFDHYIKRAESYIYKPGSNKRFKLFDLIEYLYENYPKLIKKEILNLNNLSDDKINEIVNAIPDCLLTDKHKAYIIRYLIERKKILLNIIE